MKDNKTLIFIPTYNERENVEVICSDILSLNLSFDILFLDDNSPDGTGDVLDQLVERHPNVYVIHRTGKLGIGSAHLDGIRWAYDHDYSTLVTMDCDFTHQPESIPDFVKHGETHDVVVGSRFLAEGSLQEWNLFRRSLTHLGHFVTKNFLKLEYDATGAYRLYRLDKLPREVFDIVESQGYAFFFESLYVLNLNSYSIKEISIELPARTYGNSKQSIGGAFQSLSHLLSLYLTTISNAEKFQLEYDSPDLKVIEVEDPQGWDSYWRSKKSSSSWIYGIIAAFYRKFIIKRSLNHFIKKHLDEGAQVLHAGCGSGQVDEDIRDHISITAFDISLEALSFYKQSNRNVSEILHGSIFDIPKDDGSLDGIYNLGVFEHFSHAELKQILGEFHRVLKSDGKIIIFWPPRFGVSVIFLKIIHFVLNDVLKKNIRLHPDEPSLLRSRRQAEDIFNDSNFAVAEYYFGWRDLFTQAVVVGEKR